MHPLGGLRLPQTPSCFWQSSSVIACCHYGTTECWIDIFCGAAPLGTTEEANFFFISILTNPAKIRPTILIEHRASYEYTLRCTVLNVMWVNRVCCIVESLVFQNFNTELLFLSKEQMHYVCQGYLPLNQFCCLQRVIISHHQHFLQSSKGWEMSK